MPLSTHTAQRVLQSTKTRCRGPGAALAIVKDGEAIAQEVYGFADLDRSIAMTAKTLLPICSISKQMLCLVMADLDRNPTDLMVKRGGSVEEQMTAELPNVLPALAKDPQFKDLTIAHLYNMASGIRDYWGMTVLWGANPEQSFSIANDALQALDRTKSFHFPPGTQFSYSNVNFRILGRLVEIVSGQGLSQLLASRVFVPAGMTTAALSSNTASPPLPIQGYEGSEETGYRAAANGIEWAGDAGITASLEDMIAYERYIQKGWSEPGSNYHSISQPQTWKDGKQSSYGHGLFFAKSEGLQVIGHSGGLRGFRLQRLHLPDEGFSVILLLNHEAVLGPLIRAAFRDVTGKAEDKPDQSIDASKSKWEGAYLDPITQLVTEIAAPKDGKLTMKTSWSEELMLKSANEAAGTTTSVRLDGDTLNVYRGSDNLTLTAKRLLKPQDGVDGSKNAGTYTSEETASTLHVVGGGAVPYAWFEGYLGKGPVHLLRNVGGDVWAMTCPRSMDAPAPGDWTFVFNGDGVTIGCWLARNVLYKKVKSETAIAG